MFGLNLSDQKLMLLLLTLLLSIIATLLSLIVFDDVLEELSLLLEKRPLLVLLALNLYNLPLKLLYHRLLCRDPPPVLLYLPLILAPLHLSLLTQLLLISHFLSLQHLYGLS